MRDNRNLRGWLAIPASLLLLIAGCASTPAGSPGSAAPQPMALHQGEPFEQAFSAGTDIVVLTFFDLYCVACQQSAETLINLHAALRRQYTEEEASMTGIGLGDTAFEVSVFLKKYPLPYACLSDPDKAWEKPFALKGTPTVLAFKRIGTDCLEVYRKEGRFRSGDIDSLMASLMDSPEQASQP